MFTSQACSQGSAPGTEQGAPGSPGWYWSASSAMETSPSHSHSGAGPGRSAGLSVTPQLRGVLGCSLRCCAHGRSSSSPATVRPEGGRGAEAWLARGYQGPGPWPRSETTRGPESTGERTAKGAVTGTPARAGDGKPPIISLHPR